MPLVPGSPLVTSCRGSVWHAYWHAKVERNRVLVTDRPIADLVLAHWGAKGRDTISSTLMAAMYNDLADWQCTSKT